eukprot:NODE_1613_length_431_cov_155.990132_g1603_i0.p1 GENE.NODE_1613_length_431_cov_155.990132_g1603_i0~~NODE_1613_length_431_cov_155.990132_g1603_i0.p1  ORF type:complete len:71 (-),score=2.89 NODE_1613_length_431_cov_155.990132_g1603_i0:88-300(-)
MEHLRKANIQCNNECSLVTPLHHRELPDGSDFNTTGTQLILSMDTNLIELRATDTVVPSCLRIPLIMVLL